MGKKAWRVARGVLGLRMCSWTFPDDSDGLGSDEESPDYHSPARSSIKSSCPICLETIKAGTGQAVFTAECSHGFHFSCIASNVKHGNVVCPVCRAKWNEVPWLGPPTKLNRRASPPPPITIPSPPSPPSPPPPTFNELLRQEQLQEQDPVIRIVDESIASAAAQAPPFRQQRQVVEPLVYDDDEALVSAADHQCSSSTSSDDDVDQAVGTRGSRVEISAYAEIGSVSFSEHRNLFNVLVHVKAPELSGSGATSTSLDRAPIDLVTILDVSGSMAGTKLLLLKRAMAFVIRNLSSRDRLSVVVFSSSARRLFPLKTMVEEGRQFALRAVEALVCTGGTNIVEGLRRGAKVLEDRQHKNPVASIMLLSDGHDTYSLGTRGQVFSSRISPTSSFPRQHHRKLLSNNGPVAASVPVHTFGFGADHDAATMHSISQASGGTFSFVQAEGGVQDAFAQCVGGLLSVVVQDVQLVVSTKTGGAEMGIPSITSVHAGSYVSSILENSTQATVKLGDLYADEERDVLLELKLPALEFKLHEQFILEAGCWFIDPVRREKLSTSPRKLSVARPDFVSANRQFVSIEVDRQKNRLLAAKTILEAGCLAESGDIEAAQMCLRATQDLIQSSMSLQAGDKLSKVIDSELREIQERIGNRQLYERSGRAYILSAQSSHLSQRATTRGYSSARDYQTPSMTGMLLRSQQHPCYRSSPVRT